MSQAGYTPIQLYFSTTAAAVPVNTNLANGELAINITDGKLYYKDNGGTVRLLASNATSAPVTSFSAGTTGFTPSTATTGAVTLAGTLGTANGGTNLGGATPFTSGGVVYASSTSALATGSALNWDGNLFKINSTAGQAALITQTSATGYGLAIVPGADTGYDAFTINNAANTVNNILMYGNGNAIFKGSVGIGTTSPAYKLHAVKTGGGILGRFDNADGVADIYGYGLEVTRSIAYIKGSGALHLGSAAGYSAVILDSTGNLGLGVTPSAWISSYRAFSLGYSSNGMFSGGDVQLGLTQNAYLDSGVSWRYTTSNPASQYIQVNSAHQWFIAPSGTAGNAISWTQAMTLGTDGNLILGGTSPTTSGGYTSLSINNATNSGYLILQSNGVNKSDWYVSGGGIAILRGVSVPLVLATSGADYLAFQTNATERGRFESAGTFVIKNDYQEQTYTANSSTAITLNITTNGTDQVITLTGTATITMPTATAGKSFLLKLKTGAGGYTVTWSTVKWPSGTAPTLTSTASRMDIFSFFADGTNWYGTTVGQNYTP